MNNKKKRCFLCVAALALHACGGGGGGGGSASGGDGGPSLAPTPDLRLDAANVVQSATLTFGHSRAIDLTAGLLISATAQLQLNELASIEIECSAGGTVNLRYTDTDANRLVSTGDQVTIEYASCGATSGALTLTIATVAQRGLTFDSLVGAATIDLVLSGGNQVVLSGTQTLDFSIDTDLLHWRSSDASASTTVAGRTTSARNAIVSRTIDAVTGEYTLHIAASIQAVDGAFSATTPTAFSALVGAYPETGAIDLIGGNSRANFRANDDSSVGQHFARYRFDEDGDGIFGADTLIQWNTLGAASLFGVDEDEPPDTPGEPPPTLPDLRGRLIDLGSEGNEVVLDHSRGRLYVSLPALNQIAVLDAGTLQVVRRMHGGPGPTGIALAADGSALFVAQNAAGALGVLDLETESLEQIVVAPVMRSSLAFDVVEARPGLLFATGNPGSGGFATVVRVDRDAGNVVTAAAGGTIIRAHPELLMSADGAWLFVGAGFSPNSLYRLDVSDPSAPIAREDAHGSVSGTDRMSLSPDGTRVYLRSGQVLSAETLVEIDRIGAGVPYAFSNGADVAVAAEDGALEIYDAATYQLIDRLTTDCELTGGPERLLALPQPGQWLMLSGPHLCAVDLHNPASPPGLPGSGVPPPLVETRTVVARQAVLEGAGFDLEFDSLRNQLFVSIPSAGVVVGLNAEALAPMARHTVGQAPRGIDLGPTGDELAIAFNSNGSIGFLDPDTGALDTADLTALLGDSRGHDVAYVSAEAVFMTASPNSNGLAYVVRTTRAAPSAGQRVANGDVIRAEPELAAAADGTTLFVGEGFSPNSLYRLDLTQPDAPLITEDVHGTVYGTDRLGLNADASRIVLSSGLIVRSTDFSQAGLVGPGVARFSADGALVMVAADGGTLHAYDVATLQERFVLESNCAIGVPQRLEELPSQQAWAVLGDEILCVIPTIEHASGTTTSKPVATEQRYRCDGDCLVRRYVVPLLRAPSQRAPALTPRN